MNGKLHCGACKCKPGPHTAAANHTFPRCDAHWLPVCCHTLKTTARQVLVTPASHSHGKTQHSHIPAQMPMPHEKLHSDSSSPYGTGVPIATDLTTQHPADVGAVKSGSSPQSGCQRCQQVTKPALMLTNTGAATLEQNPENAQAPTPAGGAAAATHPKSCCTAATIRFDGCRRCFCCCCRV